MSEVNICEFLSDPNYFPCNYENSPYFDKNYGHIVTWNLWLIKR